MARFAFSIDNRKCIGCHACTVACKAEHNVPLGVNRTWVKYIEKGEFPDTRRLFSVQRCNHCADAPCVEICPVTSLFTRPDGIVDFDSKRCIGCKACMQACPYDALYLDPETMTAAKCNYCTHRVDQGIEPACVVICPVEAIGSGDLDDPNSAISILDRTLRVQYPKVEKGTQPKLFYIGGEMASMDPTAAPPRAEYLWSAAEKGLSEKALLGAEREAEEETARARRVYDVRPKNENVWGWMVSAYVTTKAVAAGVVMMSFVRFILGQTAAALPGVGLALSMLFLAITGVLLVGDLKQPRRFLYVLLRPQWRSWLVRGAYLITLFALLAPICWILGVVEASRRTQTVFGAITATSAALTAVYTAFLFAQAKGRDYWQNPLLVIGMLADAMVAGAAALTIVGSWGWHIGFAPDRATGWLTAGIVVLAALLLAEFLPAHATKDAAMTARMILRGRYRVLFWGAVVFAGLIVPAVLLERGWAVPASAAWLMLFGIASKAHVLVQAPQRVPLS